MRHESRIKRALHNTAWLTFSQAGSRAIRAFIVIYGARTLGTAEYGVFSYALSLGAVFFVLAEAGLDTAMIKFAAQHPKEDRAYFSTAFILRFGLIVISAVVLFFFGSATSGLARANILLPLVAILFIADNIREFGFSLLRAREEISKEAFINILTNTVLVVVSLILIRNTPTPQALLFGYISGTLVGLVAIIITLRRDFIAIITSFTLAYVKPLMRLAWPLALTGVLGGLMINTDILMLGWFSGEAAVGAYSAAQRPISVIYGLLAIIPAALFPIILKSKGEPDIIRRGTEKILSISFLLNLPIVIGGSIVAVPFFAAILGSQFDAGVMSFRLLLPTLITNFATIALSQLFVVYEKYRMLTWIAFIGLIGNAILDLLLIPLFGGPGSALATLINQCLVAFLLWRTTASFVGANIFPRPGRGVLTAVGALAVVATLLNSANLSVWLTIGISALVYVGILFATKEPMFTEALQTFKRPTTGTEEVPKQDLMT